jgi:hypothetical protein
MAMERRPSVRVSVPAGMALGGASIVASGAIPSNSGVADALAMREDFFALGADLWAAVAAVETGARRDQPDRLFDPESV